MEKKTPDKARLAFVSKMTLAIDGKSDIHSTPKERTALSPKSAKLPATSSTLAPISSSS